MPDATRLLFAASEVYPLVKTGGLADVAKNFRCDGVYQMFQLLARTLELQSLKKGSDFCFIITMTILALDL